MREELLNHLVTIFIKSDNPALNGKMFSNNKETKFHIDGIKDIERSLNIRYRLPYLTKGINSVEDALFEHVKKGNIVVSNLSNQIYKYFFIYIPENLDEVDMGIINNIITELKGCELLIFQKNDEIFETISVDVFVQNKTKKLTKPLQSVKDQRKNPRN